MSPITRFWRRYWIQTTPISMICGCTIFERGFGNVLGHHSIPPVCYRLGDCTTGQEEEQDTPRFIITARCISLAGFEKGLTLAGTGLLPFGTSLTGMEWDTRHIDHGAPISAVTMATFGPGTVGNGRGTSSQGVSPPRHCSVDRQHAFFTVLSRGVTN